MTNQPKRGRISGYQVFYMILISRVVVTLTYFKSVSFGELSSDMLISFGLAYVLSLLLELPAYLCIIKGKNPLKVKWVAFLYMVLFLYFAAVNISRFAYFSSSRIQPESSMLFVIILITASACYSAILGIEGLGRFSVYCGMMLFLVVLIVIIANLNNIEMINYYPVFKNERSTIFKNALVFTSNSVEVLILLGLADRINAHKGKALFFGISVSYLIIFLLIFVCIGVMGYAASLYAYPGFALYQMASVTTLSRMDVIHTAFWVLSLFLKSSVYIYCAANCIRQFSHTTKCIAVSAAAGVAAIGINELTLKTNLTENAVYISLILYFIFVLLIPLLSLIFKKRTKGMR